MTAARGPRDADPAAGGLFHKGLYTTSTGVSSLNSGLFLTSQLFIRTEPCLPPTLI
jgi:hypothetical protein